MSVAGGELAFLADLSCEPEICMDSEDNRVDDGIGVPDEDDDNLLSCFIESAREGDISGHPDGRPCSEEVLQHCQQGGQDEVQIRLPPQEIANPPSTTKMAIVRNHMTPH